MCVCAVIKHPRWKPLETDRTFGTLITWFESVCAQFDCSSITKTKKTKTIKVMSCLVANYQCIRSNAVISKVAPKISAFTEFGHCGHSQHTIKCNAPAEYQDRVRPGGIDIWSSKEAATRHSAQMAVSSPRGEEKAVGCAA